MTKTDKYHKAINDCPEVEVINGDVKIVFGYIGEGISGDYTGEENDVPLMRFYVSKKELIDDPDTGTDHPDWNWVDVEDASYCTQIPVDTSKEILEKLALIILDRVEGYVNAGDSVKKLCQELSRINKTWIKD